MSSVLPNEYTVEIGKNVVNVSVTMMLFSSAGKMFVTARKTPTHV